MTLRRLHESAGRSALSALREIPCRGQKGPPTEQERPLSRRARRRASQAEKAARERSAAADVERAVESLVRWVRLVFESGAEPRPVEPFPLSYRSPTAAPYFDLKDDYWADLAQHESLRLWLEAASHDRRIQKAYGKRGQLAEATLPELRREAERFANDMLRHSASFGEQYVRSEAMVLWEDMSSETETCEVGAVVDSVTMRGDAGPVAIGPRVSPQPVVGPWAEERFADAERGPPGVWPLRRPSSVAARVGAGSIRRNKRM